MIDDHCRPDKNDHTDVQMDAPLSKDRAKTQQQPEAAVSEHGSYNCTAKSDSCSNTCSRRDNIAEAQSSATSERLAHDTSRDYSSCRVSLSLGKDDGAADSPSESEVSQARHTSEAGVEDIYDEEILRNYKKDADKLHPGGRSQIRRRKRSPERPPWKDALYQRQPYADNYVPDAFLMKLVTNAYVRQPDLRFYVMNTFTVTQQISAVALFFVVFMYMQDSLIAVETLVFVDLLLLFGGYGIILLLSPKNGGHAGIHREAKPMGGEVRSGEGARASFEARPAPRAQRPGVADNEQLKLSSVSSTLGRCFLFLGILRIMAPVLRTLTVSYADDTIYALAITMSILHLAFHDYSYANTASGRFQGTLSLNAAMFAAVLLASRLKNNENVFGLVLFAIDLFAFFPLARREMKRYSVLLHVCVTWAVVLPPGVFLFSRHQTLFAAYLATIVLVTVACPLWLLRVQRYKLRIEGPWDIAHVVALP